MNRKPHAKAVCPIIGKSFRIHCCHSPILIHSSGDTPELINPNKNSNDTRKKKQQIIDFFLVHFHIFIILWLKQLGKRAC